MADNEGSLRYYYGTRSFEYITLACIIRWQDVVLTVNPTLSAFTHTVANLNVLRAAVDKNAVVHMIVTAPQLPQDHSAIYSIYISEREATEDRGPASPGYVGTIPVVIGSREHQHNMPMPGAIALDLTGRAKNLLERREQNTLYAVQRTPKPDQKRVLKVPFRNVSYRVGEVAQG